MKQKILETQGFNRYSYWTYTYWLSQASDGSYSLSLEQMVMGDTELDLRVEPVHGLLTGSEVYDALSNMIGTIEGDEGNFTPAEVAAVIAVLNPELAEQFRRTPEERVVADAVVQQAEAERWQALLEPLQERIEAYVAAHFSDEKLRYPGGGALPSRRYWARRFIEEYVAAHGHLPTGEHSIRVTGFSGGLHLFSDWDVPAR